MPLFLYSNVNTISRALTAYRNGFIASVYNSYSSITCKRQKNTNHIYLVAAHVIFRRNVRIVLKSCIIGRWFFRLARLVYIDRQFLRMSHSRNHEYTATKSPASFQRLFHGQWHSWVIYFVFENLLRRKIMVMTVYSSAYENLLAWEEIYWPRINEVVFLSNYAFYY